MQEELLLRAPIMRKKVPQFSMNEFNLFSSSLIGDEEEDDYFLSSPLHLSNTTESFDYGLNFFQLSFQQRNELSILNVLYNRHHMLRKERQSFR
jgi:hypothetical protein